MDVVCRTKALALPILHTCNGPMENGEWGETGVRSPHLNVELGKDGVTCAFSPPPRVSNACAG